MKTTKLLWVGLALAVLSAGCTIQTMVPHTKGKVMISAERTTSRSLAGGSPLLRGLQSHPKIDKATLPNRLTGASSTAVSSRSAKAATRSISHTRSRDLSADTDIQSMSYTVINLDPNSDEAPITDSIEPWWPYVDLYLTPGQRYRITVDVVLTASAPGANVGITHFGDQSDFYVDDWYDTYVDLYVHPVGAPVFNQSFTGMTINAVNSSTGATINGLGSNGTVTHLPSDKFFYTSDAKLYYFNKNADAVYEWTNLASLLDVSTATPFIDGNSATVDGVSGQTIALAAICADPAWAGWFYAVGYDGTAGHWYLYQIYVNGGTPEWYTYNYYDSQYAEYWLTTNNAASAVTSVPTGITADIYGDVFVSFYNHGTSTEPVDSGILQYYQGYFYQWLIWNTGYLTTDWTNAQSIFTDVTFEGGNLYALTSPLTAPGWSGSVPANTGTSEIFVLDYYLNEVLSRPSTISNTYTSSPPGLVANALSLPNRFAGPVQGGSLFISQTDFAAATTGTELLSRVATDLTSISAP